MEGVHKMEDWASVKSKAAGPAISTLGDTLAMQKRSEMAATSIGTVSQRFTRSRHKYGNTVKIDSAE